QNSNSVDVATVASNGAASFASVTQTGSGGNLILSTGTLQAGATFYVSSGTAAGPLYANTYARVGGVIGRDWSTVTVNTANESAVYSTTVPANALGTSRTLRIMLYGTWLQNTGGNASLIYSLYLGPTKVLTMTGGADVSSASL